jgi:hypothetical protein
VAYIGGAVVLAAWLASAASTRGPDGPQPAVRPVATSGTEQLAADVQAQSARLRQRLASAPVPRKPTRNPFAFGERESLRTHVVSSRPVVVPEPAAAPPPIEPALALIGIAAQSSARGLVRTAMIVGPGDELYMVAEGQAVAGRYVVAAIGADAVELRDDTTGLTRRLALR